jgi:hypothetical protein
MSRPCHKNESNDFIKCHAILDNLLKVFICTDDWNTLRKAGVIECLEDAMHAIKPGYEKELVP